MDYQAIGQYVVAVVKAFTDLLDLSPGSTLPFPPDSIGIVPPAAAASPSSSTFSLTSSSNNIATGGGTAARRDVVRRTRTVYNHRSVRLRLHSLYFGPNPKGKFKKTYRITVERFRTIYQDIKETDGNRFFFPYSSRTREKRDKFACPEARMLVAIHCLAHGCSPICLSDHYQMSESFARECCNQFDIIINRRYLTTYLRQPTPEDLSNIVKLHEKQHGVKGMFGSLDCMHIHWKNCPMAWKGSYQGKEGIPTMVLEAACDYNMWIWHSFAGAAGTLNDVSIMRLSRIYKSFLDGSMAKLERQANVVPYSINGVDDFNELFLLVDGIYPKYSRFVKGIKDPINQAEKSYTAWQEACRKDIERAFGNLQAKWKWIASPILLLDTKSITRRVSTCVILHNMCVSDRIMKNNPRAVYNPAAAYVIDEDEDEEENSNKNNDDNNSGDSEDDEGEEEEQAFAPVRFYHQSDLADEEDGLAAGDRLQSLRNADLHARLFLALIKQHCP